MESHIALAAEKLFQIGPIPITNSILTTWVVTFILIVFALVSTRKIAAVPSSLQNFAEILVESFQNLVASIAEDKTKIFLPIVASFFFFILLGNYFGLLEIISEFTKVLSLSFRLLGNIYAGEVVLTTAATRFYAFLLPLPFYFLELLVGFIQALIFAILTLVFMVILTQKSEH